MRRGKARIILGAILIVLQLMSFAGSAKAGIGFQISFASPILFLADLIFWVSYCFFGIAGAILLISGVVAYSKGEYDEPIEEVITTPKEPEELPGPNIPLSIILPILGTVFVVILTIVLILERS